MLRVDALPVRCICADERFDLDEAAFDALCAPAELVGYLGDTGAASLELELGVVAGGNALTAPSVSAALTPVVCTHTGRVHSRRSCAAPRGWPPKRLIRMRLKIKISLRQSYYPTRMLPLLQLLVPTTIKRHRPKSSKLRR